jgi:Zn-dependent protease with chaperone function
LGYLIHLLAALAIATAIEVAQAAGSPRGAGGAGAAVLLAGGLVLPLPHLLAALARRLALAGRFRASRAAALALEASAPLAFGSVLWAGYGELLRGWIGEGASLLGWPGPGLLLLLLPFVGLQWLAIHARARLTEATAARRRAQTRFHGRMLAAALLPLSGYLLLNGAVSLWPTVRLHVEEVALLGTAYAALLIALFAYGLPALLTRVWDTTPVPDGGLRRFLLEIARRGRFRFRELLLWRTGYSVSNAAIVGFTPGQRVVLMTDGLLGELDAGELAAVFSHEMGHSARRHALLFAAFTGALFLGYGLLAAGLDGGSETLGHVALFTAGLTWFLGFGFLSRRAELDADLFALEVLGRPEPLVQALERVAGGGGRWSGGWRHFSVANRVLFLRAAAVDPGVGLRLRAQLRRWGWTSSLVVLLGGALWIGGQAAQWPRDRGVVALRSGDYEGALALLAPATGNGDGGAEGAGADERALLRALAQRGADHARGGGSTDAGALLARAAAAAEAGELGPALEWATLARLRGAVEADGPLEAIELVLAGETERVETLRATLPEPWARLFSAADRQATGVP